MVPQVGGKEEISPAGCLKRARHTLCIYCSSSFCVLTLMLSQNSRFCSHFLLGGEINDKRGGCLWHSSTCLQILYKILFPWTRQKQQAGDSFSEGGAAWPAASALLSKIPGDFPSTIFPMVIHTVTCAWFSLLPLGSAGTPGLLARRHHPGSERCILRSLSKPPLLGTALN